MCGNSLGLASPLKHKELGQDSDGLQPDGERPEDLGDGVVDREEDGEDSSTTEEVLNTESVDVRVVCGFVCVGHEVDNVALRADKHDLEDQVVQAVSRKQVWSKVRRVAAGGIPGMGDEPRYLVTYTSRYKTCDLKEIPEQLYSRVSSVAR